MLGVLAAVVVSALPSTTSVTLPTDATTSTSARPGQATTTSTTRSVLSGALLAQCVADVQAVQRAAQDYAALNAVEPPAGTAWATSSQHSGPFLRAWPGDGAHYRVGWNGATVVVVPVHGRESVGSAGTRSPPSGCDTF